MSKWTNQLQEVLLGNYNLITDVITGQSMTLDEVFRRGYFYGKSLKLVDQTILPVLLPNSIEYLIVYIGAITNGLIFAPIPYMLSGKEVQNILSHYDSNFLITDRVDTHFRVERPPNLATYELNVDDTMKFTIKQPLNTDLASLYYSSGTTGTPKGILYTHENKFSLISSIVKDFRFTKSTKHFVFLPFGHTAALNYSIFPSLFTGSNLLIASGFEKVRSNFFNVLADNKVNYVQLVPTVAQTLIKLRVGVSDLDLSSLKFMGCGSAPLSKNVQIEFYGTFKKQLANLYGLSETGPSHIDNPLVSGWEPGSIGVPLSVNECKIADDGEILLKGNNIMKGYYKNDELTREVINNGWFHTGDYGYEHKGKYYFLDRKKDLIVIGGINVYPAEIENVLYKDSRVIEASVFSVQDEVLGEKIVAYIKCTVRDHDSYMQTETDLINLCKGDLSRFKIPAVIVFTDEMPKTASGKILRRELKKLYLQRYNKNEYQ
jgi:long-chain acyl-CoA synthetase